VRKREEIKKRNVRFKSTGVEFILKYNSLLNGIRRIHKKL
jgi:hypothetical protein